MNKNSGFTLVELSILIVILSVLSIVALHIFLNLNDDATVASLNGHKAAFIDSLAILKVIHIIVEEPNKLDVHGNTLHFFNSYTNSIK